MLMMFSLLYLKCFVKAFVICVLKMRTWEVMGINRFRIVVQRIKLCAVCGSCTAISTCLTYDFKFQ